MKKMAVMVALCGVMAPLLGQEVEIKEPKEEVAGLPQWNVEDWERLKSGELIPGSSIFGGIALERLLSTDHDPIELAPDVRSVPEEKVEQEEFPTQIGGEFLSRYFHHPPDSFLVDPQDLLTGLEKEDREGFLKFHAEDSGLDLYLYLFDAKQELPVGESLTGIILDHFAEKESAAVVFYFMGDPERSELSFTEDLSGEISRGNKRDLLKFSIEEAMEQEEPLAQLEAFSSHLSERLYRLEKMLEEEGLLADQLQGPDSSEAEEEISSVAMLWADFKGNREAFSAVVISISFAFSVGLFVFLRSLVDRNRVFIFPDAQGSPLMGAPHAPGVGSVISYSNRTQPPSIQRNNYPDYLQRM